MSFWSAILWNKWIHQQEGIKVQVGHVWMKGEAMDSGVPSENVWTCPEGGHIGTPPNPCGQDDRQTQLKILPSPLRWRAIISSSLTPLISLKLIIGFHLFVTILFPQHQLKLLKSILIHCKHQLGTSRTNDRWNFFTEIEAVIYLNLQRSSMIVHNYHWSTHKGDQDKQHTHCRSNEPFTKTWKIVSLRQWIC